MTNIWASPVILLVRGYRKFISPYISNRCKYYPTCSSYSLECLEKHGLIKGFLLTLWRLVRCNPFSMGGVDYPPKMGKWKRPEYHQMSEEELQAHWESLANNNSL